MPESAKKPSLFGRIETPQRKEGAVVGRPGVGKRFRPAKPAVELKDGKAIFHNEPDRPYHICLKCKHFLGPVHIKESFKPTGRTHVEFTGGCLRNTELDLTSETVLRCNGFKAPMGIVSKLALAGGAFSAAAWGLTWLLHLGGV